MATAAVAEEGILRLRTTSLRSVRTPLGMTPPGIGFQIQARFIRRNSITNVFHSIAMFIWPWPSVLSSTH